jgi:hypothetical protein
MEDQRVPQDVHLLLRIKIPVLQDRPDDYVVSIMLSTVSHLGNPLGRSEANGSVGRGIRGHLQ